MALGWNEIKERAVKFSKEWAGTFNEEADAKPFLIDFFNVFGISQRSVATFEHRVKKLGEFDGYIDMLWKGTMVIEMKSRGKSLDKAFSQANDYLHGLNSFSNCTINTPPVYLWWRKRRKDPLGSNKNNDQEPERIKHV